MAPTAQDTATSETPSEEPSRPPSRARSTVFGWAGVLAAGTAAAVLAIVTLAPDDGNQPPGRPLSDQRDTTRDLEGSAEDTAGSTASGPACSWTSEINVPAYPPNDLGPAPTPESVLTFEKCQGEWTGRMGWVNPVGPDAGPDAP